MLVQAFSPEPTVEYFDEGVFRWLARPLEAEHNAALTGPEVQVARDELAALIDSDRLRTARRSANPVERGYHVLAPLCVAR